jgi:hypothetical protein
VPGKQGKQRSPAIWGLLSITPIVLVWAYFVWKEIKEYKNDPKINPIKQVILLVAVFLLPMVFGSIFVSIFLTILPSLILVYILGILISIIPGVAFFLYRNMFNHVRDMQVSSGTSEEKTLNATKLSALITLPVVVQGAVNGILVLLVWITGLSILSLIGLILFILWFVPAYGVFLGQARLNQIWVNLGQKRMKDKLGKKIIKILGDAAGDLVEDATGSKKLGKKIDKGVTKGLKKEQKSHKPHRPSPDQHWPPEPYPPQQGQFDQYPPQQGQLDQNPPQQAQYGQYPPQQGQLDQHPPQQAQFDQHPPQQVIVNLNVPPGQQQPPPQY